MTNIEKQYDLLVYIGRFQPFHVGHKHSLDHALKISKKVLVVIGSSNKPRDIQNPFSYKERCELIKENYTIEQQNQLVFEPAVDSLNRRS